MPWASGRTHHGEALDLRDLGGSSVLLMFYPFAFSRVCGAELARLHAAEENFRLLNARAVAISCDSIHTLRAYAQELTGADASLSVDLLSDFWPHGRIAEQFGVFDEERGAATRASFIFDPELILRHVQQVPVHQERDLDEALDALARVG